MMRLLANRLMPLIAFLIWSLPGNANINNLEVHPDDPTSEDDIKIIANTQFGNSPCGLDSSDMSSSNGTLNMNAYYSSGFMPAICNSEDTISVGQIHGGSYQLIFNLYEGNSIQDQDTVNFSVTQIGPDPAGIVGPDSICQDESLLYSVDSADQNLSYTWDCSGVLNCGGSDTSTTVTSSTAGEGYVKVTASDNENSTTDSKKVVVHPSPVQPTIVGDDEACEGDQSIYEVDNFQNELDYSWNCSGAAECQDAGGEQDQVTFNEMGEGTIEVIAKSPFGCGKDTATKEVEVHRTPEVEQITGPGEACQGTSQPYNVEPYYEELNYDWECSGGANCEDDTGESINVTFADDQASDIEVVASSPEGCPADIASKNVEVHPVPEDHEIQGSAEACEGQTDTFEVTPWQPDDFTYEWICDEKADCGIPENGENHITFTEEGESEVMVTAESPEGCGIDTAAFEVNIHPSPEAKEISGVEEICEQSTETFSVEGYDPDFDYEWVCEGASECQAETGETAEIQFPHGGEATISLITSSPEGCSADTSSQKITVNPEPAEPQIEGPSFGCRGESAFYNVADYDESFDYNWDCSNAINCPEEAVGEEVEIGFAEAGEAELQLTKTSPEGCGADSSSINLTIEREPEAPAIEGPDTVTVNDTVIYQIIDPQEDLDYNWQCSGAVECEDLTGESVQAYFAQTGEAVIEALAEDTCGSASVEKSIFVKDEETFIDERTTYERDISIYPNPSNGVFEVEWQEGFNKIHSIRVISLNGQVIKERNPDDDAKEFAIDMRDHSNGAYWIEVKDNENTYRQQIIVR